MMYSIAKFVCLIATKIFIRPKLIDKNNMPLKGGFIIASNHISMFDPVILITSTKRRIHFLAKNSIFKFPLSVVFSNLQLIKVNRDNNDSIALEESIKYLKDGHVIGIFPEGTRERGRGLLDLKYGAVKMAKETAMPIIPVGIKGKYCIFSKNLTFKFGKPIYINGELEKENERLKKTIESLLK